jgi:hypothetical protein
MENGTCRLAAKTMVAASAASSPAKDFSERDCFEFYFRDKTAG